MSTALIVGIAATRGANGPRQAPGFVRSLPRAAAARRLPKVVCAAVEPAAPDASTSTASKVAARPVQTVAVTFKCFLKVRFGEHVRVVGSTEQLGRWTADKGPELKWSEGDVWTGTVELPVGEAVEFKFVHMLTGGRVSWENTPNRSFTAAAGGAQSVTTQWNNPMANFEAVAKPIPSTEALELLDTPLFSTVLVPGEADELAAAGASGAKAAAPKDAASTASAQLTTAPAAAAPEIKGDAEGKPAESGPAGPAGFGSMDQKGGFSGRKQTKKQQKKRFRFMN